MLVQILFQHKDPLCPKHYSIPWKLDLFLFCPISEWLWVLQAQKTNWNASCSSVTVSCLLFSCYDCISSPDSTVKPFEEDSSWKLHPCRRDCSFYPHHLFIYVLVSFSSCFKGLKKTEDFFFFSFSPPHLLFFLTFSFQGLQVLVGCSMVLE